MMYTPSLFPHRSASLTLLLTALFFLGGVFISPPASAYHLPDETAGHSTPGPSSGGTSQTPGPSSGGNSQTPGTFGLQLENPLKFNSIVDLLKAILDIVIIFAVPIIIFFIIWAGFLYVTAQGDPGKIKDARVALTWTVIGGLLILGAWVLVEVIQGTVDALR